MDAEMIIRIAWAIKNPFSKSRSRDSSNQRLEFFAHLEGLCDVERGHDHHVPTTFFYQLMGRVLRSTLG